MANDLISVNNSGTGGTAVTETGLVSVSADGRYVVFTSAANDIVSGDTGQIDVFLRDTLTNETKLVSTGVAGKGNASAQQVEISADGKYIVFNSVSSNLVPNDTNGVADVFRYEVATGNIDLVSATAMARSNGNSGEASISSDGRYISFSSHATNLIAADAENGKDIYWRDMVTGELAVLTAAGYSGEAINSTISGDGRFVTFESPMSNLGGISNSINNIFQTDLYNNTMQRLTNFASDPGLLEPSVSSDGKFVVFQTAAVIMSDAGPDALGKSDVFMLDVQAGQYKLISKNTSGGFANGDSYGGMITPDGRYVVYSSAANDMAANDTQGEDVFVWDSTLNETRLLSRDETGAQSNGDSKAPSISADGKYVVFYSTATDLNAADTSPNTDVYRVSLNKAPTLTGDLALTVAKGAKTILTSTELGYTDPDDVSTVIKYAVSNLAAGTVLVDNVAATSFTHADLVGGKVAFQHDGSNTSGSFDVAVDDGNQDASTPTASLFNVRLSTAGPETQLVSLNAAGTAASGYSEAPWVSPRSLSTDGRYVVFASSATDLVSGDTNGKEDVFLRDMVTGTTTLVSVGTGVNDGDSDSARVSDDGKFVVFESDATNLVAGDTNGENDLFVRDLVAGTTTRVSVGYENGNNNQEAALGGTSGVISADGTKVVFVTSSSLAASDSNSSSDIYVRDLQLGTTTLVSVDTNGNATGGNGFPGMSANGQYVVFGSDATNLAQ